MVPISPTAALRSHADDARALIVETVHARHDSAAEGHEVARTRFAFGFGSQWRDLLEDVVQAFRDRGYPSFKVSPAGYRLPVVGGCIVYVWRVPEKPNAVSGFADSPSRLSGFFAAEPVELFGSSFVEGGVEARSAREQEEVERAIRDAGKTMPFVLVMVHSTPRQLTSIRWAVAEYLDGNVELHGEEVIWDALIEAETVDVDVESFDSGIPNGPTIEPQKQDRPTDG